MNIDDIDICEYFELEGCPECQGTGILEEEGGAEFYVMCMECGGHTVSINYKKKEDRFDAAKRAVDLWNMGKIISASPGE